MSPIKAGDLLYTVGPSSRATNDPTALIVHSAVIKRVRLEGSFSTSVTPAELTNAPRIIELDGDRPLIGFPKWIYREHEVGSSVHRSAADALRGFTKQAQARRDDAARALERANRELEWAAAQAPILKEMP